MEVAQITRLQITKSISFAIKSHQGLITKNIIDQVLCGSPRVDNYL